MTNVGEEVEGRELCVIMKSEHEVSRLRSGDG